ncbi:MAG TPA: hypothetical protein VHZ26_00495 [Caulobacteraceae bacterium]|jgi:hypothetical protein|nr:hypothetical protein [Caulobacteraceae bacterium]
MTGELEVFRAELRAAGQPWSRLGIWLAGAGMLLLVGAQLMGQIAPIAPYFFTVLGLSLVLLAVGWASLLAAFLKRRQWAKAHPLILPGLSGTGHGTSEA